MYEEMTVAQLKAVDNVSFSVDRNEVFGLVGESGCGKSTISRTILRLYEPTAGRIIYDGNDITSISDQEMMKYRRRMQMVFQDPFASLDPRMTVGDIIAEPMVIQRQLKKKDAIPAAK